MLRKKKEAGFGLRQREAALSYEEKRLKAEHNAALEQKREAAQQRKEYEFELRGVADLARLKGDSYIRPATPESVSGQEKEASQIGPKRICTAKLRAQEVALRSLEEESRTAGVFAEQKRVESESMGEGDAKEEKIAYLRQV